MKEVQKKCKKCKKKRPLNQFGETKRYYVNSEGQRIVYSYPRHMCNSCMWPAKALKKANSLRDANFVVGGIRVY